jgi:protein-L-isoaspartate(D-aspartate) O-methyltransferase
VTPRLWLWLLALALGASPGCRQRDGGERIGTGPAPEEAAPQPASSSPRHPAFAERRAERERMVRQDMAERGIKEPRVLAAMRTVPRHAFVPEGWQAEAYADRPLPIGSGQTISQPYIVAFMTEAAKPRPRDRCLEIGTGSGYQAAVLAELCQRTYSIEYLPEVAKQGEQNLRSIGYGPDRVELRTGDGYKGWPEAAPFDVILVTAAPERVPKPLLEQLAMAGRLVIPVGPIETGQELERWTRIEKGQDEGAFKSERLLSVRFVPFLGDGVKEQER